MTTDRETRDAAYARLDRLWARGRAFLGTEYAILGGAMSWLSEHRLVAAISNAGGFGVIAAGSMSPELLDREIERTFAGTDKPFGVNVIVMHPELDALIGVCLARKVSHIVLAGGLAPRAVAERVHEAGAKVICFAPTLPVARRLARQRCDALIIEGMEAGGHTGPVSTNVLAQEILPHLREVPVFVGGGIGRGDALALYLGLGAAGCQLGTRFVCATESIAHPEFKKAFIRAKARDAVPSAQIDPLFPVIPVRAIANEGTRRFVEVQRAVIERYRAGELSQKEARLEIEQFWAGALRRAVIEGDVRTGSLMAGQSVGMVSAEQSTAAILEELVAQASGALGARDGTGDRG